MKELRTALALAVLLIIAFWLGFGLAAVAVRSTVAEPAEPCVVVPYDPSERP
jgi:hypothetical protein